MLSKESLKIDMVIKKDKDAQVQKNIGQIFKGHNLFEFKSETDNLSIHDYNKVIGYGMLYAAFNHIHIQDITVSFVLTQHPSKLLKYLREKRNLEFVETHRGIYYLKDEIIAVQIIEQKKLSSTENLFIKNLSSSINENDVKHIMESYKMGLIGGKNSYFDTIVRANFEVFEEEINMSEDLIEMFKEAALEHGWMDEVLEEERKEGKEEEKFIFAKKLLAKGMSLEEICELTELPMERILQAQTFAENR